MKTLVKTLMVMVLAIAMAFTPEALNAQARRSATGTSGSSATRSSNTSVSSSRESSAAASDVSRSSSASRSSASSVSRSSGSASTAQSGTASRSSAQQQSGTTRRSSATTASRSTGESQGSVQQSGNTRRSSATTTSRSSSSATTGSNASGTSTTSRRSSAGTVSSETRAAQSSQSNTTSRRSASGTVGREATSINSNDLGRAAQASRRSANATASKGLTPVGENSVQRENAPQAKISNMSGRDAHMKLNNHEVLRIPPREREHVMAYDAPAHFFARDPHYFGYRIHSLPPRPHRMVHWGVTYYYYNNIYYRPWGSVYVVCRPPFGVCIERAMVSAALRDLRFAYYHNAYYTYREIDANYRTIDEQNRIIARNNATIAAQNAAMALNANRAYSAYELANQLGLVQSYADAATKYYYEDGVFFVVNAKGQYEVIVPPAGALVSELPDDYETLVMNGIEYYRVDNTVYRVTLVDGTPYLEVLGQMPTRVAKQYGYVF